MSNCIARIFESLLRLLLPAPGRHRPEGAYASIPRRTDPPPVRTRLVRVPMLRGEDSVMVRPYLVAYERREAARRHCGCHHVRWPDGQGAELRRRPTKRVEVAAR